MDPQFELLQEVQNDNHEQEATSKIAIVVNNQTTEPWQPLSIQQTGPPVLSSKETIIPPYPEGIHNQSTRKDPSTLGMTLMEDTRQNNKVTTTEQSIHHDGNKESQEDNLANNTTTNKTNVEDIWPKIAWLMTFPNRYVISILEEEEKQKHNVEIRFCHSSRR